MTGFACLVLGSQHVGQPSTWRGRRDRQHVSACGIASMESWVTRQRTWSREARRPQRSPGSGACQICQWNLASHVIARGCGRRDRCRVLVCGSASMESRVARNRTWSREVRRPQVCRPRFVPATQAPWRPVGRCWALGPLRSILQIHSGRVSRLQASPQPRASCHGCVLSR